VRPAELHRGKAAVFLPVLADELPLTPDNTRRPSSYGATMQVEKDNPKTVADAESQWEFYRDLRRRTLRRAELARRAEAQRRRRIEQAMRVTRQRPFRNVD
jgi:hypothetical protein